MTERPPKPEPERPPKPPPKPTRWPLEDRERRSIAAWVNRMLDIGALETWDEEEEVYREQNSPDAVLMPEPVPTPPKSSRGRKPKPRHPFDLPPQRMKGRGRGRPTKRKDERDPLLASVADDARAIMKLWDGAYGRHVKGYVRRHVKDDAVDLAIERWANICDRTPTELNDMWVKEPTRRPDREKNRENPADKYTLMDAVHDELKH